MKIYQVDSFTTEKFKGNPAGVCITDKFPDSSLMQSIALEMNLSETAFVEIDNNSFNIRYFTPTQEVALCGHATLASAHILYELGIIKNDFVFKAQECDLPISMQDGWIKMNFPGYKLSKIDINPRFNEIIGINAIETFKSDNDWIVALVENEQDVINAKPDFEAIERENIGMLIAVTALSTDAEFDFVVRVFCNPVCGITEDPVTGAANCILVPFWNLKTGKDGFKSKQLSKRTGVLKTAMDGNRINIFGQAKMIFTIEMNN
jgi:PhzF family phenazine biosynthesis protein